MTTWLKIFLKFPLSFPDTDGEWTSGPFLGNIPLGSGSNPGNLGQDIRNLNNPNITVNIIDSGTFGPESNRECN